MSKDKFTVNSHDLLMLFQSGQGADCVIEVVSQIDDQQPEKKEFNVHKYVLMVNSDVFHAMFSHENMKEAREGRIRIMDSTGTAVRQMLIYMYTGELPKEYAIATDAGPLMHIANKYLIQSLVQLIEQGLLYSLSLKNVLDQLEMADLYQIKSLYFSCGQLIRRNLKMVMKDAKWLKLIMKSPELVFSILDKFAEEIEIMNVELFQRKNESFTQKGQMCQLQRENVALRNRLQKYEREQEQDQQNRREEGQRYLDAKREAAINSNRRTLQRMAELFESPIPTTSNVARLRRNFGIEDDIESGSYAVQFMDVENVYQEPAYIDDDDDDGTN